MILFLLRGLFILMATLVAALYATKAFTGSAFGIVLAIVAAMALSGAIVLADVLTPRKKLSAISGVYVGLLVGLIAAWSLTFLVDYIQLLFHDAPGELMQGLKIFLGVICIFIAITLVLQTKDDFRFVIPYVEFAKQIRGNRPMLLDTSAIIDGRILDVADTQILQGLMVVPRFVLNELQTISDSADKLKRARGRRGLDIVAKLQSNPLIDLSIEDADAEGATVDQKLIALAQDLHARIITTDFNLTKVAELRGVSVVNVNKLAEALRPVVLPGELMSVKIVKPGESPGQGVGYLEDGTMVVVEHSRDRIGQDLPLTVTSVLQTSAGRMIFGRPASGEPLDAHAAPPIKPLAASRSPENRRRN